ncbi:bidirectional sugar transporter [Musa troglodytarum]|uniref:Bidirectional sugar transporter SWEET n=1 Tax=Musa troglodytarum TaxID=320322 RepID=A0A9E7JM13_9LILI|nr:bidirectional sugar transporter [Musa troglodytarum]
MVFLSPIPTFYRIYRKKSTEGFQSVPYVVALSSCMLLIYYALVKTNAILLITINSFGCFIETAYITIYLIYATKKARLLYLLNILHVIVHLCYELASAIPVRELQVFCIQIFVLLNVVAFAAIVLLTRLAFTGPDRVTVVGWICVGFSLCVFAAPLSIIRLVIRTKSVEFMPFYLSFFLTLNAIAWFGYGFFTKDLYVELPNVLGFVFGVAQMVVYILYKNKKKRKDAAVAAVPEHRVKIAELSSAPASELQVSLEEKDQNKRSTEASQDTDKNEAADEEGPDISAVRGIGDLMDHLVYTSSTSYD